MNAPRFEYWRSKINGQWYFRFLAGNGKIVCQSEGYKRKAGCLNGIESIRDGWRRGARAVEVRGAFTGEE